MLGTNTIFVQDNGHLLWFLTKYGKNSPRLPCKIIPFFVVAYVFLKKMMMMIKFMPQTLFFSHLPSNLPFPNVLTVIHTHTFIIIIFHNFFPLRRENRPVFLNLTEKY